MTAAVLAAVVLPKPALPSFSVLPVQERRDATRVHAAASMAANGLVIAFESFAALVPEDRNGTRDVYLADLATSEIVLVSRTPDGRAGNGPSHTPSISADGARVAFTSAAPDLAQGDRGQRSHVFVFERSSRRVTLLSGDSVASIVPTESHAPRISADGRIVAYQMAAGAAGAHAGCVEVIRVEVDTGTRQCVSCVPDNEHRDAVHATRPGLSADGSTIVYLRRLARSQPADHEIWLHAHTRNAALRLDGIGPGSRTMDEVLTPEMSADGRWLTFAAYPRRTAGTDGRRASQIYVQALPNGRPMLVTATAAGRPANGNSLLPSMSADGARIAFQSTASNLPCGRSVPRCDDINLVADVFIWDRSTRHITRITPPSGHPPWLNPSEAPVLSGDGRVVAFLSRQPVSADDERSHFNLYVVRSDTQAISGSGP